MWRSHEAAHGLFLLLGSGASTARSKEQCIIERRILKACSHCHHNMQIPLGTVV